MNNNHDDKKDKTEESFINNLFEKKEKDQNEQLYKNEFYILEEEIKSKKNQNSLQFMHDILLNKLMLEDYVPFPPKNDEPIIVNNQKEEKKKEDDQDKLIEEENEFLRSLHKINYLTFSPFGLSFFEDNGKDKSTMNEDLLKEREDKILHMIDFNYDSLEVTNDLSYAKVYYTYMGEESPEDVKKNLEVAEPYLRTMLASKMKDLRKMPELRFYVDESIEYGNNIERILNDIKKDDE